MAERDDRTLHRALERVGPRFTLGDLLLQESHALDADAESLRGRVIIAVELVGGHLDVDRETNEVVRAGARGGGETGGAAKRDAGRPSGVWDVFSRQRGVDDHGGGSGDRGGGGGTVFVGPNADFWYYLYMRDLIDLMLWNDMARRDRAMYERARYGVESEVVKPGNSGQAGGSGGGPGGGPDEDARRDDPERGRPNAANVPGRRRANGNEDDDGDDDEDEDDWLDRGRELTFVESIFAFVFGRGDPNERLETRRWRAVGALLRVNKGCVYAEQVAPFLDSYLLSKEDHNEVKNGLFASIFDVVSHARRIFRKKQAENERDTSKMHEGYMLEVLTRFGGHAEASDDGKLIYVFPSLQVTTIAEAAASSRSTPGRAVPPPTPPPIYERVRPLWESGPKMPLVVALGFLNIFMIYVFHALGGMDLKPRERVPLEPRQKQTMGRRAGRFRDDSPVAIDISDEPPLVILFLELFPWLCRIMMPLLVVYATIFFVMPTSRALCVAIENRRVVRRNDIRKRRALETFNMAIQETEKQARARGKQNLERRARLRAFGPDANMPAVSVLLASDYFVGSVFYLIGSACFLVGTAYFLRDAVRVLKTA
ncbi:mitochondrial Fe-S cluster biosynthesis protein ISA2 [Ostreococcus tauri]|uniref:Mitochondrial Fe-S cluster biosynthesis protein ISA2 n=1 Tax=Ostreococcus tauri TaxID=70448 RepID=A0A1Y5I7C3_OSTTA|nr:mitochondrial Fe-S cluster biosynthesis protein ISA2 [Ostreococcus tauri]